MHYHLEIVMPPTDDVKAAIAQILAPFDERAEDDENKSSCPFWDWYKIGGRWGGNKAMPSEAEMKPFYAALNEAKTTVSSFTAGKQTLMPPEQSAAVDALWRKYFPASPFHACPVFDNYIGDTGDVMRLADVPQGLTCEHVVIAAPGYNDKLMAESMFQRKIWNGVSYVETTWDGTLEAAIEDHHKHLKGCKPEYQAKKMPGPDWLVVTIDYHS